MFFNTQEGTCSEAAAHFDAAWQAVSGGLETQLDVVQNTFGRQLELHGAVPARGVAKCTFEQLCCGDMGAVGLRLIYGIKWGCGGTYIKYRYNI